MSRGAQPQQWQGLAEIKAAGCTSNEIKAAGCTIEEVQAAGCTMEWTWSGPLRRPKGASRWGRTFNASSNDVLLAYLQSLLDHPVVEMTTCEDRDIDELIAVTLTGRWSSMDTRVKRFGL